MEIIIENDASKRASLAADIVVRELLSKENPVLGLATGSSPLPVYDELVRRYENKEISFANVTAFTLDEYVGIDPEHPESYRNVIHNAFTGRVDFKPENVNCPDGNAKDLLAACARYDQAIAALGGTDVQIIGIGSDGHIAFNEPGGSIISRTHPEALTLETRQDNARFFDNKLELVPTHCVTQGIGTIMTSAHPVLVSSTKHKAKAIRDMCEGPVSATCPASILQMHPNVTIIIDEDAASLLERKDYYIHRYATKIW